MANRSRQLAARTSRRQISAQGRRMIGSTGGFVPRSKQAQTIILQQRAEEARRQENLRQQAFLENQIKLYTNEMQRQLNIAGSEPGVAGQNARTEMERANATIKILKSRLNEVKAGGNFVDINAVVSEARRIGSQAKRPGVGRISQRALGVQRVVDPKTGKDLGAVRPGESVSGAKARIGQEKVERAKEIRELEKSLPAGDKVLFDKTTLRIRGIESKKLGQTIPYTQKAITRYNLELIKKPTGKSLVEILEAASRQKGYNILNYKPFRNLKLKDTRQLEKERLAAKDKLVELIVKSTGSKIPQSEIFRYIRFVNLNELKDIGFVNDVKRFLRKEGSVVYVKGKKVVLGSIAKLDKFLAKERIVTGYEPQFGTITPNAPNGMVKKEYVTTYGTQVRGALKVLALPAKARDWTLGRTKLGWEMILFDKGTAGIGFKRGGKLELVPKIIAGTGYVASYLIPGVGTGFIISEAAKGSEVFLYPQDEVNKVIKREYENYIKNTKLGENERHLTKDEFTKLNQTEVFNSIRKSVAISLGVNIALFVALRGLIKIGSKSIKLVKGTKLYKDFVKAIKLVKRKEITQPLAKLKKQIAKKVLTKNSYKNYVKSSKIRLADKKLLADLKKISGKKISKAEFESYKKAVKDFERIKVLSKNVKKIKGLRGGGRIQTLKKSYRLSPAERKLLSKYGSIDERILKKVDDVEVGVISTAYKVKTPVINRVQLQGTARYNIVFKDAIYYQNTVSYLFKGNNKKLTTIILNNISKKPLNKFKSVANALKYGSRPSLIISERQGDFVFSREFNFFRKTIDTKEYVSKIERVKGKVRGGGVIRKIKTRRIFEKSKSIEKSFKRGSPVSKTSVLERRLRVREKFKDGSLIITRDKRVTDILLYPKVESVVLKKSIVNREIMRMNKLWLQSKDKALLKRIKLMKNILKAAKKPKLKTLRVKGSKTPILKGKGIVTITKKNFKTLKKLADLRDLKLKTLSAATIKPSIKVRRSIVGRLKRGKAKTRAKVLVRVKSKAKIRGGKIKTDVATAQQTGVVQARKQATDQLLKQTSALSLKTKTVTITTIPTVLTPRGGRRTRTDTIKKKLIIPFKLFGKPSGKKTLSKEEMTYDIYVKKKGKFVLAAQRLIEKDARSFAAYELDNTLRRTAKVKEGGFQKVVTKLPAKYDRAFSKVNYKIRPYSIRKGKKKALGGYIEKTKYIVDTRGEKKELALSKRKPVKKLSKKRVRTPRKKITRVVKRKPARRKVVKRRRKR